MTENEISKIIVDICYRVHRSLEPGLFESVYEAVLTHELHEKGFSILRQHGIPIVWKGIHIEQGFRADLIVENKVLIEIKSVKEIAPVHKKQVLTYLKLAELKLGLLVNFNEELIRDGITRVVNRL